MGQKFRAFIISASGTALPCLIAGAIVGIFFRSSFWYWTLGIAVLALFYVCLDRIPVRLFAGSMRGLSLWSLLKYGFASTEKRPVISEEMVNEENEWRTITYNHFYGDDR
ncbi:MAG: hypothetical protein HGB32_01165 [Geobacteraceae bacterium]|nr:hypothetical protein [Desulfuromonadaceae bacterium]NTV49263.1 hypothetical protein [Geobacteraceae bacterium]NTW78741.1 hypothetical protein [Geobacteraceae bacterium]